MTKKIKRLPDDSLAGFLFASPYIIGFFVFNFYPIVMSAYYSFTNFSAIKKPKWVGLENYSALFKDPLFFKSLSNTLYYSVIAVPLIILLSIVIASLLNMDIKFRGVLRSIFFIPSIVPIVASAMVWIWILNPVNGFLNGFLKIFGAPTINWLGDYRYTKVSLVIITLWGIGTTIVLFLAAIQDIPRALYEAADIDGANSIQKFFGITIPNITHIIVYQVILAIINCFQYFTQAYVIITAQSGVLVSGTEGGPQYSLLMYPLYLFYNAFNKLNMGRASAMAWLLFVFVGLLTIVIKKVSDKWSMYD